MVRCVLEANVYGVKVEGETLEQKNQKKNPAALLRSVFLLTRYGTKIAQAMKGGSAWQLWF